jgi:dihydroorotase
MTSRKEFLRMGIAAAAAPSLAAPASGRYDLLITGGRVIDPARAVDGVFDVAIASGKIAQIGANLPHARAQKVFDAAGKIVTPGLIDIHGHVYDQVLPVSIDPDVVGIPKGVTTIVDAGSAGAATFAGFRKFIVERAHTRVYALLNISSIGLVVLNELYIDPKLIDPQAAIKTIQENRDVIVGIKVRINGRDEEVEHDVDALHKAREASDATGVPIMLHWTNHPRLLGILKKGDILVHPFNPERSGPNLLGGDSKVLPQILELKERGIFTDFAHGTHLQWDTAEKAAQQGWFPDSISTDIHRLHAGPNGTVFDLTTTISKFLYLGLPLERAIQCVTANPARMLSFPEKIGSLGVGNPADISILNLEQGTFDLLDSNRGKRTTSRRLAPVATVRAGNLQAAPAAGR